MVTMLGRAPRARATSWPYMLVEIFFAVVVRELGAGRYALAREDKYSTARTNRFAVAYARMIDVFCRV